MAFLILGMLLLALKLAEFGPVATWSWWVVLLPFGLATALVGLCRRDRADAAPRDGQDGADQGRAAQPQPGSAGPGHAPRPQGAPRQPFPASDAGKRAAKDPATATADDVGRR